MLIIPALNLKNGSVVRLRQGDPRNTVFFSDDPVAVARRFVEMGVRRLSIHDVDSLLGDDFPHMEIAARIAEETGAKVQYGAAIDDVARLDEALEQPFVLIELRADRVAGTELLHDALRRNAARLALRLDVRNGYVDLKAPERAGQADPVALARELVEVGTQRLVFSDLNRDGMLGGPNYAGLRALLHVIDVPVMVAGGIAHHDHIRNLERLGAEGVIIGKALYTGDLSLKGHIDENGAWRR